MSLHMALGFLFLGGGRSTLSTAPLATACLLISLFPRFPTATDDQRYHLQALRHLWTLAAQPRCIQTVDADTGETCHVPLEIVTTSSTRLRTITPCLLPHLSTIHSVTLMSPRYYPLRMDAAHRIFVKRRGGRWSYTDDWSGLKNINSRSFPVQIPNMEQGSLSMKGTTEQKKRYEFIMSFNNHPDVRSFASQFCHDSPLSSLCIDLLYDCLLHDKLETLPVLMGLVELSWKLSKSLIDTHDVMCTRMIIQYYTHHQPIAHTSTTHTTSYATLPLSEGSANIVLDDQDMEEYMLGEGKATPILHTSFIERIQHDMHDMFTQTLMNIPIQQYITAIMNNERPTINGILGAFLAYYSIPSPSILHTGLISVCSLMSMMSTHPTTSTATTDDARATMFVVCVGIVFETKIQPQAARVLYEGIKLFIK
jgi:hypothetical protein